MRARLGVGGLVALVGLMGCESEEPPQCEADGIPTCSSTLVIDRADESASDFVVTIEAESEGLDLQIFCPTPADEEARAGDIVWFCGAGRLTLERPDEWPTTLTVGFGGTFPTEFTPDYSPGLDRCGNLCNDGTITL